MLAQNMCETAHTDVGPDGSVRQSVTESPRKARWPVCRRAANDCSVAANNRPTRQPVPKQPPVYSFVFPPESIVQVSGCCKHGIPNNYMSSYHDQVMQNSNTF
jgi:hypothetical protein